MSSKKAISLSGSVKRAGKGVINDKQDERVKLTLKVSQDLYDRMAQYGLSNRQKHQEIMHAALEQYLNDVGA